jgi:hypothetical protein
MKNLDNKSRRAAGGAHHLSICSVPYDPQPTGDLVIERRLRVGDIAIPLTARFLLSDVTFTVEEPNSFITRGTYVGTIDSTSAWGFVVNAHGEGPDPIFVPFLDRMFIEPGIYALNAIANFSISVPEAGLRGVLQGGGVVLR